MTKRLINLIDKLEKDRILTREELVYIIENHNKESDAYLFEKSRKVRERVYGKNVYIRGLIEFTNICKNNCYYCGIRAGAKNAERYRLTKEQISDCADAGYELGFRTFVLQGGEDPVNNPIEYVLESIKTIYSIKHKNGAIRRVNVNIAATTVENYRKLKEAGIGTYILFQETYNKKSYEELHPTGPKHDYAYHTEAMDRAMKGGIDDEGELGELRVKKSYQMLNKTDIAVVVVDGDNLSLEDTMIVRKIQEKKLPFIIFYNKIEDDRAGKTIIDNGVISVYGRATDKVGISELKEAIIGLNANKIPEKKLVSDLIEYGDIVVLVVPIDSAAPKGRLILPQQQVIRDILEAGAMPVVTRESELALTLDKLGVKPSLVICDSQVFEYVNKTVPDDIRLTSFSILFARYKGDFRQAIESARTIESIQDGDKILISEGCTHHRQCGDIGTEKLPRWIRQYTKAEPEFTFTSGTEFPENIEEYKLIIHCGACMLNEKEVKYRYKSAKEKNVPMVNYGMAIAYMHGILKRSLGALKN